MTTILAVDDEPSNLKVIERYLGDTGYRLVTAENGIDGWRLVQQLGADLDIILLDRMMPGMDGITFMHTIKAAPAYRHIPVIMQTAAAEASQVAEGVRSGVYYYLTKPFTRRVLLALIDAALRDHAEQDLLRSEVRKQKTILGLIRRGEFTFRTLQEARDLTTYLANCFPYPERVVLGLSELLINAVEHGNLGITYEEKGELHERGAWLAEVERRLQLNENREKYVEVFFEKQEGKAILTIKDQGPGFHWHAFLDIAPERATHSHGRGIAMSRLLSFDTVDYLGDGNVVVCTVAY